NRAGEDHQWQAGPGQHPPPDAGERQPAQGAAEAADSRGAGGCHCRRQRDPGSEEPGESGLSVALDDFVYSDVWKPLIQVASFIKLDVMSLGIEGVKEQLAQIRLCGNTKGKLVAEKVETHEEFERYKELG